MFSTMFRAGSPREEVSSRDPFPRKSYPKCFLHILVKSSMTVRTPLNPHQIENEAKEAFSVIEELLNLIEADITVDQ